MKKLTVIKAESAVRAEALGLKPFHIDDMTREARELIAATRRKSEAAATRAQAMLAEAEAKLARAKADAERIRNSAQQEAETVREAARQEGRRAGHEEGSKKGAEEGRAQALEEARREFAENQAQLVAALRAVIESVERGRADWLADGRRDLIELAVAIARRVARHVGQRDREVVLANLEEAVRLVGARSQFAIAVNPADAEAARVFAQSLLDLKEHREHIQVIEEPEVSPGGCLVHWGSGLVDAALETQLDRIELELKGE